MPPLEAARDDEIHKGAVSTLKTCVHVDSLLNFNFRDQRSWTWSS